jgi:hypothetical protein
MRAAMSGGPPGAADDQAHRPRRTGLRTRDARHGRERDSTGCQMEKSTARKFHGVSPGNNGYFALIPAALMIGHHFSISAF